MVWQTSRSGRSSTYLPTRVETDIRGCGDAAVIDVADALPDERGELAELATTRHGNFHKSRCR
jgi:hypothetical protein